jgi:predicted nucleotide-binding protein
VKHEDNNTNSSTTTTVKPDHPKHTLEEALALPEAISRNGGQPLPPIDTATAMNRSPGSSIFRMVTGASHQYGLTNGSYKSDYFTLEDLGRGVIEPNDPNERPRNLVAAALRPPLFQALFDYYRGKRFPEKQFFVNTVKREFNVPEQQAERCVDIFTANMHFVGLIRATPGGDWLSKEPTTEGPTVPVPVEAMEDVQAVDKHLTDQVAVEEQPPSVPSEPEKKRRPNVLFVGHGGSTKPVTQLTKLLDQVGIPYKVAEEEASLGRPISTKVRQTMEECGGGIFVFTADREYRDKEGNPVWLSSENVANELGAAAVLYDDRIILFKEESVELASNYSGVGYISFEKDKLDAKMPELLKELVAMKILKVSMDE